MELVREIEEWMKTNCIQPKNRLRQILVFTRNLKDNIYVEKFILTKIVSLVVENTSFPRNRHQVHSIFSMVIIIFHAQTTQPLARPRFIRLVSSTNSQTP